MGCFENQFLTLQMVAPVVVLYCGVCTLPAEFCEFSGMHAECTQWWAKHHPEVGSGVACSPVFQRTNTHTHPKKALEVAAGANAEAVTAALQAASLAGGAAAASSSAAASAEEPAKPAKGGKKKVL